MTYLGAEEMRRAYRLAVGHNIPPDNEIWYGAPTFKQANRAMWNRLKRNIPEDWIQSRPNNTESVMQMKTGHVMRVVGLDDPDALRGSGLWFFLGDEWDDASRATRRLPLSTSRAVSPSEMGEMREVVKINMPRF